MRTKTLSISRPLMYLIMLLTLAFLALPVKSEDSPDNWSSLSDQSRIDVLHFLAFVKLPDAEMAIFYLKRFEERIPVLVAAFTPGTDRIEGLSPPSKEAYKKSLHVTTANFYAYAINTLGCVCRPGELDSLYGRYEALLANIRDSTAVSEEKETINQAIAQIENYRQQLKANGV